MNFAELIYGEVGFRFYTVSASLRHSGDETAGDKAAVQCLP
jgi:hypothetical protein